MKEHAKEHPAKAAPTPPTNETGAETVSNPTPKREKKAKETKNHTNKPPSQPSKQGQGGVTASVADSPEPAGEDGGQARGETRIEATDRWRREGRNEEVIAFRTAVREDCRASGMAKKDARDIAWDKAIAKFPPLESGESVIPEAVSGDTKEVTDSKRQTPAVLGGQVRGLGDIPADWGELPQNASQQAELAWVQANRLTIIEEQASGATVVHLDRARAPAPSMAALGWLETSIRSYAKYVDVVARSLREEDEGDDEVKRARVAIEEIKALLVEMHQHGLDAYRR